MLTPRRLTVILLAVFSATMLLALATSKARRLAHTQTEPVKQPGGNQLEALSQTYIEINPGKPITVPAMRAINGSAFSETQLQGHWSLIFFGYTNCPLVCPKTLSLLGALARNPKSGVISGHVQLVFVSIDPERDTSEQLGTYLRHFDAHILGLTGSRDAIQSFSSQIGAGFQHAGTTIDHSSSLFVVDPAGQLTAILLRPDNPVRLLADLKKLGLHDGGASAASDVTNH